MKKLLSLLLALAMLLGYMAFAEDVDYTGVWVLTGAETSGITMGPTTLALMGMDSVTMTIQADGTVVLSMLGMDDAGTWGLTEGGILMNDGTVDQLVTYQDEILYMVQGDEVMMFTREGAAPAIDDTLPAVVVLANVEPAAFEGKWLLTSATVFGIEMAAEELGVYMALELAEGQCLFTGTDETGSLTSEELTYTVEEAEGVGTVMTVGQVDEATGEMAEVMSLNLLEDGRLYMPMDVEGLTVEYFFTRQVEEAAE